MKNQDLAQKRKLGMMLLLGGLVPLIAMMVYIVYTETNSPYIIALTIVCWVVFFAGKTMLKTKDPKPGLK